MQRKAHEEDIGAGPSKEVAQEFIDATPKSKRSAFMKALKKKKNVKR